MWTSIFGVSGALRGWGLDKLDHRDLAEVSSPSRRLLRNLLRNQRR
jgi:hypothetical protein